MAKVSLIIPCYFADMELVAITDTCLDSLLTTLKQPLWLILVDDGSPVQDYMHKAIQEHGTRIIRETNGGYAAAVNTGLEYAMGDIIIICNNDVEFIQPDWLEQLLKPLHNEYDISSIRTTDADGWGTEDKITEGDKFGSIWAMKRIVYETIGGLDESFGKGYFEDLDYQKRAEEAGFRVAKNHAGIVEHRGKATFSRVDPTDASYLAAMERFKKKYGSVW